VSHANDICFRQLYIPSCVATKSLSHNISPCLQLVSSVLFLTESGGPTLVLDQDPQGPLASRGWLGQPCPNQLLAFKGNLLHGVIPGKHHLIPAICMTPVPSRNIFPLALEDSFLPCIHVSGMQSHHSHSVRAYPDNPNWNMGLCVTL